MAKSSLKAGARKKRRFYLVLTSVAVLSLALALVLSALEDSISLFYDPTEVQEKQISAGLTFRLGGIVAEDSFTNAEQDGIMVSHFSITDGNAMVRVRYEGLLPDLFREGQGVVTEGAMGADGLFIASNVLAKHDENYMPKEVVDSLKKRGQWQKHMGQKNVGQEDAASEDGQ